MRRSPGIVLVGLLALAGPATATIGTIDNVPAATLLLPYFEVDLDNPQGANTLFSINNSVGSAVLTKVVVWSDQAVPVLNFNVYLTGYDVQTISMRDLLVLGNVPSTASAGQDPGNQISPKGPISGDVDFPSCSGVLPLANPAISNSFRGHIQAWLTGSQSPQTQNCAGSKPDFGEERIARGYVTVDTVSACDINFPGNWASYGPVLTDDNVIWGDWFLVNPAQNFAQGDMLVHIESCPSCFTAGDHTFDGRYSGGVADDSREPLPTTWASRFLVGGPFDGGTSMLIWREGNSRTEAYSCQLDGPPSWYPLEFKQVLIFDEQEQPTTEETCPLVCEERVFIHNNTQRVSVADDLLTPFDFGWVYLNLQHPDLVYGDEAAQSWVIVVMDAVGRFSVGFDVLQLDNANDPAGTIGAPF
jgi:hypothetical protein